MNPRPIGTILLLSLVSIATAQPPASPKKPPVGVPLDAQFFDGKWYRVYAEKIPWHAAKQKCVAVAGQLAVVPDEATWTFIKRLSAGAQLWLGATDEEVSGVWKWIDGTPVTFKAWGEGQPDNYGGNQHYMFILKGTWNDIQKDGKFSDPSIRVVGYICEWKDK
jgi:hypothetical protein